MGQDGNLTEWGREGKLNGCEGELNSMGGKTEQGEEMTKERIELLNKKTVRTLTTKDRYK